MSTSTKQTHTPGPWTCKVGVSAPFVDQEKRTIRPHYVLNQEQGGHYRPQVVTEDEANANARLIAAAPEMREALAALFEHCAMVHKYWGDGCNQQQADAAIKQARALLARIDGAE